MFDQFEAGLIVADATGDLVASNAAAERIAEASPAGGWHLLAEPRHLSRP